MLYGLMINKLGIDFKIVICLIGWCVGLLLLIKYELCEYKCIVGSFIIVFSFSVFLV